MSFPCRDLLSGGISFGSSLMESNNNNDNNYLRIFWQENLQIHSVINRALHTACAFGHPLFQEVNYTPTGINHAQFYSKHLLGNLQGDKLQRF